MTNKTSVIKNLRNDAFVQFSEQHGSRFKFSLLNERLNTKQETLSSVYLKCNICITFLIKRKFFPRNYCHNYRSFFKRDESRISNCVVSNDSTSKQSVRVRPICISVCQKKKRKKLFLVTTITKPKTKVIVFEDGNLLPAHSRQDINISKIFNLVVTDRRKRSFAGFWWKMVISLLLNCIYKGWGFILTNGSVRTKLFLP